MVSGVIPACKWVRLACERHFRDLDRSCDKDPGFPWRYSAPRAARACTFIEGMPHTKGKWASKAELLVLEPWQCFIVCSLFGWVDTGSSSKYRYQEAYICCPRKQGKSPMAAAIGLFKLAADHDFGAEVYSGATTEKQAWEVFKPAKIMAERTDDFRDGFGIKVNAKSITIPTSGAKFEPVIGNPGDGASVSCAIIDEFHEHDTPALYDTMKTGMAARENPLLLVITTAGVNRSGPCFALQTNVQHILDRKLRNERLFGIIYGIDEDQGDDWRSEAALIKANPNYGVSVTPDFVQKMQQEAIQSATAQNSFKTKHLNIWCGAGVGWMNMAAWEACRDPHLSLDDFARQECYIAVDLASRVDIASKVRLFKRAIDGKVHYYIFAAHYLNEETAKTTAYYQGWEADEKLIVTPGNVTDLGWIAEGLMEDTKRFIVLEIPHDPYQSEPLLQTMKARPDWNQNVRLVAVDATTANFSAAMKELEAIVLDGRLHHPGDPVMDWMVSNVVCHRDVKDNIYPRKERPENKIDGAVALIMGINRAVANGGVVQGSVYSTRGMRFL